MELNIKVSFASILLLPKPYLYEKKRFTIGRKQDIIPENTDGWKPVAKKMRDDVLTGKKTWVCKTEKGR